MALPSATPARLRFLSWSAVAAAAVLLVALSVLMAAVKDQVRVIGAEAAPRAATASELYFGLSDLDAQVARLVLIQDDDRFAAGQADALGAYQQRGDEIDAGLQRAGAGPEVLALTNGLAVYRRQAWQALTVGSPDGALGYYTQATNTLHLDLLPAARALRDQGQDRLDDAYAAKRLTELLALAVVVLLGVTLVVLLTGLQVFLARRFRRLVNPALLAATGIAAVLLVAAGTVLVLQDRRLGDARDASFTPYLELSQARADSYDAAADTGRYLLSAGYQQDFARKSEPLAALGERWQAYERDHERIVALADAGRRDEAIAALTGIRRGDAAFDFFYFDSEVRVVADGHRRDFDRALHDTEGLLTGWVLIPIVALGLVIALVPLGVRRRLAEYR